MKNAHPIISATASSPVGPDSTSLGESAEPIIRLKLQKPLHWEWELTTSADALPVIQLLDKDGRLLVETTGRTAQRARGSFREGLRTHEQFSADEPAGTSRSKQPSSSSPASSASRVVSPPLQGNRNIDGFSSKFGTCNFAPRKSKSDVNVKEGRGRKRHSTAAEDPTTNVVERGVERTTSDLKKYSAGDYLRHQIMNDLRTRSTIGRSPEEIAKDRCRKVKAYLRSQSETLLSLVREEDHGADGTKNAKTDGSLGRSVAKLHARRNDTTERRNGPETKVDSKEENKRAKSYLRTRSAALPGSEISVGENKSNEGDRIVRKIKDDASEAELAKIREFLREKIQRRMNMEQVRSPSAVRADRDVPGTAENAGIRKRYSDYRHESDRKNYRTRKVRSETSVIRFDPEALERERLRSGKQLKREKPTNCGESLEDSQCQRQSRNYRLSRSEALIEATEPTDRARSRTRRESSSLERRKLYRKTKSDVLLGQAATSADSAKDLGNPPRRIKSQENVERSWREYKERKRNERLRRDSEREMPEEDFMSKPRWLDLQRELCSSANCKVCQNLRNCVDPLQEGSEAELPSTRKEGNARISADETSSTRSGSRPGTSLQENYLLVEENACEGQRSPVAAKPRAKERGDDIGECEASALNVGSPDFGYNSIPKSVFKDYRELYAHSNVKKSDTFKIVDGSEDPEKRAKINGDAFDADFSFLNNEGLPANKSNEDISKDYFKRVYELLKRRQEETRKSSADDERAFPGQDDSSSSNYVDEMQRKRNRGPRKKEKSPQGEEVVTVPSTSSGQEGWKVAQRLSVSSESPQSSNRRRGCPLQSQVVSGGKRNRPAPPPPPPPISCRINAKDIDKYFDWPNKENTPGNAVNRREDDQANRVATDVPTMGSNLSRHNGKGLTGRRTQSSGNLCDPKGKLNSMGKTPVPCSSAPRERYKFCGSLPNHLDDKDVLEDDQRDNNNIMSDNIGGSFGGTLPHKKRSLGVHFPDSGPTGALDLVKHRSQDSLDENNPWRLKQSDLDLVQRPRGNFDSVKRNPNADTVLGNSARRSGRDVFLQERCHRNSDLDLVGTLPKRKQDVRNSGRSLQSNSSSSQPCIVNTTNNDGGADNDLLMKIVHKPDCELFKHRQQFGKCVDLKLSRLASGGEPQDQGYASERSPEDEHPPSLPGQPFPSENTFRVTLQKSSRGLGLSVSGGGTAGPVRVKRLFPQQPAALSNKLQSGDILLAANGISLTDLTNYEALEVLRTTASTVELLVRRLPGDSNITPPGAPPPPPARREPPPPLRILKPLPPLQIEPCGEFDIEMTKVGGSLGFTLRKADCSALGHYIRALVREPALSDGRIRPGDKIVAVDGAPLSPMSHEEAVQLLRQCGPTVKLRLYRDLAQTPVSALSPTEPDHPLRPPRTSLRQEAVDMLCDLAVRKLSPGTSSGSSCKQQSPGASCNSPRRLRRLATRTPTAETEQGTPEKQHDVQTASTASQAETSDSDQCSVRTQITNSQTNTPSTDIIDPPPLYDVCDEPGCDSSRLSNGSAARPSFLDLSAPQGKPHFQFCSLDSDGDYPGDVILAEAECGRLAEPSYDNDRSVTVLSSDEHDNDLPSEPASMPPMLSSTSSTSTAAFSYKNPAYQSANPACGASSDPPGPKSKATHSSDQDIPGKILGTDDPAGSKGLLKWKGVMFAPDDGVDQVEHDREETEKDATDSTAPVEDLEQGSEVFMVELTRGWNSRLGFSLRPEGNRTVISVVHSDSVAAKDGRLKQGDVLIMVNEESVEHMSTADIIDLLRKIRGSIGITVMRKSKQDNVT